MIGHVPVLADEVLAQLAPRPGGTVVDGTAGLGGHAERIAGALGPTGTLILLDLDAGILERARERVAAIGPRVIARHGSFARMRHVLDELALPGADGILLDLGINSVQLDDPERGLSFRFDGPLDMRLDRSEGETAAELVARLTETDLADLLYRYGEERRSRAVARAIVQERRRSPIRTTGALATILRQVIHGRPGGIDPATRCFQALRIAVNRELESLENFLGSVTDCLNPGGRAAIIAFHSLEDRLVKQAFRREAGLGRLRLLTRKPLRPGEVEERDNPRARSARLRVAERVHPGSGG